MDSNSNKTSDEDWRNTLEMFRHNVIAKLQEAIVQSGVSLSRTASSFESQIFSNSRSKEEYVRLIARLVEHINRRKPSEVSKKDEQGPAGLQTSLQNEHIGQDGSNSQMSMRQSEMIQIQHGRIQYRIPQKSDMERTNWFQQPPTQMTTRQVSASQSVGNIQTNQNMIIHGQRFANSPASMQIQGNWPQIDTKQGLPENRGEMIRNPIPPKIIIGQQRTLGSPIIQKTFQQGSQWTVLESNGLPFTTVTRHQSPHWQHIPHRAQFSPPSTSRKLPNVEQLSPSPSFNAMLNQAGPSNTVTSSENTLGSCQTSGIHSPLALQFNTPTRRPNPADMSLQSPSPGSNLNTPLSSPNPSPVNDSRRAIFEKIKAMQKYRNLLQKVMLKIGHQDPAKCHKLKKLLDVLKNPNNMVPLGMLSKYELVLKAIARQYYGFLDSRAPSSPINKISPINQIQYAILCTLRKVSSDPTQSLTVEPKVVKDTPQTPKSENNDTDCSSDDEPKNGIPITLQKELQFLDKRYGFKLTNNDGTAVSRIVYITLQDPQLPKVPTLKIVVSDNYPMEKPTFLNFNQEYDCNPFFRSVASSMKSRLSCVENQPTLTVTEIITCWEVSVRQTTDSFYAKSNKNQNRL